MAKKNADFKILFMLLSSLISNCLCFSSKGYKNCDKRKISGVNYYRRKKFNARRSKKSNLVRNTVVTSGVGIGLTYLGKKYFVKDSTVKSDDINEPKLDKREKIDKIQGEVNLNDADKEYIRRNFFLCAWENNSCWNDVFVQFFMCPDVRRGKYNSKAIMTTIDFINSVLGQEYNGDCLCRKVKCPINKRPIFKYFDEIKQEWHYADYYLRNSMFNYCALFESFFDNQATTDLGLFGATSSLDDNWDIPEDFSENTIRREDWFEDWGIDSLKTEERLVYSIRFEKIEKWNSSNIFFENVGYYPTFIRIFRSNHFVSYYIIYNENKEVKYFLLADSMDENMVVLSKEQALEQIGVSKSVNIVYTKSDVVEKCYIP